MSAETQKRPTSKQLWDNRYPYWKFLFELSYMSMIIVIWLFHIKHSLQVKPNPLAVVLGFIAQQFVVDFISGFFHWACDTWGTFYTPFFGPTLIRAFRMHHVDPQDITKHGFVQTNASTTYPSLPWLIGGFYMIPGTFGGDMYLWMVNFGILSTLFTNEAHKWAHMVHSKPNKVVRFLQASGLIMSHEHHHRHHQGKFDNSYCIINGWMNPILEYFDFWRRLENIITKLTGAIPRSDDEFWRTVKKDQ